MPASFIRRTEGRQHISVNMKKHIDVLENKPVLNLGLVLIIVYFFTQLEICHMVRGYFLVIKKYISYLSMKLEPSVVLLRRPIQII